MHLVFLVVSLLVLLGGPEAPAAQAGSPSGKFFGGNHLGGGLQMDSPSLKVKHSNKTEYKNTLN